PDGTVWPLVIQAVALLGGTAPGIETLADITDLYGVAASARRVVVAATPVGGREPATARTRAVAVAPARRTRFARSVSYERHPARAPQPRPRTPPRPVRTSPPKRLPW